MRYYHDFVKPTKRFRAPDAVEREALQALDAALAALPPDADAETIQNALYDVGRSFERYQTPPKEAGERPGVALTWFATLYELLLGQERGPRFGSFVAIYGIPETRALIEKALSRRASSAPRGELVGLSARPGSGRPSLKRPSFSSRAAFSASS